MDAFRSEHADLIRTENQGTRRKTLESDQGPCRRFETRWKTTLGEVKSRDAVEARKNMQRYKKLIEGEERLCRIKTSVISFELPKITLEVSR